MSRPSRSVVPLVVLLALAGAVRALYLAAYATSDPFYDHLLHDAKRYHEWASALASGSQDAAGPFYQAPLYPYLLALVYLVAGPRPLAAYVLQLLLGCATVLLVWRSARRIGDERGALLAAALAAFYGTCVFYETKLLPATLTVFLTAAAIDRLQATALGASDARSVQPGIVLGLGALANPGSLVFVALAAVWLRRRPRRVAFLLASAALVVLPVTVRNLVVGHELVLISTNAGITLYQGNNPRAEGYFATPDGFSGSVFLQREESRVLAERDAGRPLRDREVSRFWLAKGLRFLGTHPILVVRKLALALDGYEQPLEYHPELDANPARFAVPVSFALLLSLASLFFFAGARPSSTPPFLAIVAQTLVLLVFYVSSRYRLPVAPALAILGGVGAVAASDRLRAEPRRALVPLLVGVVVGGLSMAGRLATPHRIASLEAQGLSDRGGAFVAAGRTKEAIELYRAAIRRDPGYAFARLDLGHALVAAGDRREAERSFRDAIRIDPSAEAHLALGVLLYEEGRLPEAADEFREAFRLDPSAAAGNNLIGVLRSLARPAEAVAVGRELRRLGIPIDPPLEAWLRGVN